MELVDKFDNITITLEKQIPAADAEFCRQEDAFYRRTIDQLNGTIKLAKEMYLQANNDAVSIHTSAWKDGELFNCPHLESPKENLHPWVTNHQTADNVDDAYKSFEFGWGYVIRDCVRLKRKVFARFTKRIVDYFTKKYQMELSKALDEHISELNFEVTWLDILEMIKTDMGGILDFKGGAVEQAVETFREKCKWRKPVAKGSIVEFESYMWFSRGETEFNIWQHEKDLKALDAAISIFELEEVRENYAIMYLIGKKLSWDWDAPLNGEKLEGIRFFKNKKMQLRFKDGLLAQAFIRRFQLNSVNS